MPICQFSKTLQHYRVKMILNFDKSMTSASVQV